MASVGEFADEANRIVEETGTQWAAGVEAIGGRVERGDDLLDHAVFRRQDFRELHSRFLETFSM
jgi:hypothetical protein